MTSRAGATSRRRGRDRLHLSDMLLLVAVVLLPWAFGGTEIWAHRLAQFLLVAALVARQLRERRAVHASWPLAEIRWLLLPAVALLIWGAIQVVPLPDKLLGALSPNAHQIHETTLEGDRLSLATLERHALEAVPEADSLSPPRPASARSMELATIEVPASRTLSLMPSVSVERLHWYGALLLAFVLTYSSARRSGIYRRLETILFLNFIFLALFAIAFAAFGNDKLYWFRNTVQPTRPFGPYVNPTNFAAVMEMAVPWMLSATFSAMRGRKGGIPAPMLIAGTLCCFVAGILAGSKAAALLIVAAVVVVVLRRQRGRVPVRWLAAGLLLSALAAALLLPMTTLGDRVRQFVQTADGGVAGLERVVGWRSAAQIVPDFAWSGVGAGAFAEIFPAYAPSGGDLRLSHAHNDYLELLVELGIPGALLTALLMLLYFGLACRQAGRSRTRFGLLVGLCTVSLHALVDFNHQIPSIALLFVVLAALAVIPRSRVKR